MKFKITLKVLDTESIIPLSYQYEVSGWMNRMFNKMDSSLSHFLTDKGFQALPGRRFKLYTFSSLFISRFEISEDRMRILCEEVSLVLSVFLPESAEALILELFKAQPVSITDYITRANFEVKDIHRMPEEDIAETVFLRTTSPLMISRTSFKNKRPQINYLNPKDADFDILFFQQLTQKFMAARVHDLINPLPNDSNLQLKLLSSPQEIKTRTIKIKANTPEEGTMRGFLFDFELTAPIPLIKFGMYSGFGQENSLGFGSTMIIKDTKYAITKKKEQNPIPDQYKPFSKFKVLENLKDNEPNENPNPTPDEDDSL
jgi:CRISPR-associated endoribonuclease Cas6